MKHYRGGKYSAFDAGTRIPFIVRWPNGIKPGKQQAPFSMIDVYASLAALLDHPLEAGIAPDSRDQLNNFWEPTLPDVTILYNRIWTIHSPLSKETGNT